MVDRKARKDFLCKNGNEKEWGNSAAKKPVFIRLLQKFFIFEEGGGGIVSEI